MHGASVLRMEALKLSTNTTCKFYLQIDFIFPTKHLCILVPALYCTLFATVLNNGTENCAIWDKFALYLVHYDQNLKKIKGDIWNEYREQH